MDLKEIKSIYKFLRKTDIVELELEMGGAKLRLKRGGIPAAEEIAAGPVASSAPTPPAPASAATKESANIKTINSPMVGTFYMAPTPEAAPFVEKGSLIKKGQSVCIIEAMKLMNEIESDYSGTIVEILVENGQPIEYGEPLFKVEI